MLLLDSNGDATIATAIRAAITLVLIVILAIVLVKRGHKKAVIVSTVIGLVLGIGNFIFLLFEISPSVSLGMKILAAASTSILTACMPISLYAIHRILRKLRIRRNNRRKLKRSKKR